MRALAKTKDEPGLWLTDEPVPVIGPDEVLIRVNKTGICGTDIHIYGWDDWARTTVPVPMGVGHEYAGEIAEVGYAVRGLARGQRVSGEGHVIGMHSRAVRGGRFHLDPQTRGIGVHIPGAFAEFVKIPAFNVVPLPDDIDDELGAILDPLGNAVHTALAFGLVGEDVLVTGAGPIGIMAAAVARHVGARHVVITDVNASRLALAAEVADVVPVDVSKEDLTSVTARLGMKEGFDVGLEMSGAPAAFGQMVGHLVMGGKIAMLGIPGQTLRRQLERGRVPDADHQGHLRARDVRDLAQDAGHAAKRPRGAQGYHAPPAGPRLPARLRGHAERQLRQSRAGLDGIVTGRWMETVNRPSRDGPDDQHRNGTHGTRPSVWSGAKSLPRSHDDTEADDELDRVFPGCSFTHMLAVVSRDQLSVTINVLSAIRNLGGGLDSLRLTRVAGKLEQRFRVTGLRPRQARLLSKRLADVVGVEHASVEHQILRVSPANGRSM